MNTRSVFGSAVACGLVLAAAGWGIAAEDTFEKSAGPAAKAAPASVAARLDVLESKLDRLAQHLGVDLARTARMAATEASGTPSAPPPPATLSERVAALENLVQALDQRLTHAEEYTSQLYNDVADLKKIGIAGQLDKINATVGDIDKRMRGVYELQTRVPNGAAAPGAPALGRFVIENWTGAPQAVAVNGVRYTCPPGRTEVSVPYGPVITELIGFEPPKEWTDWKRRNGGYEMVMEIRY